MSNLKELNVGDLVTEKMVVIDELSVKVARNKSLVNNLTIRDASGTIPAVYFGKLETGIAKNSVVIIDGSVQLYNDGAQISINSMSKSDGDNKKFILSIMPTSRYSNAALVKMVTKQIERIKDLELKEFVASVLDENPDYFTSPAGKKVHHNYVGGLAEHSYNVCVIASTAAQLYEGINMDMVIAGCLLHDIGKIEEMTSEITIDYSDRGRMAGHSYLGARIIEDHARSQFIDQAVLNDLVHIILSHHGELQYGAVLSPVTIEAQICHLSDRLDAHTAAVQAMIKTDMNPGQWTAFNQLLNRAMRKPAVAAVKKILVEEEVLA